MNNDLLFIKLTSRYKQYQSIEPSSQLMELALQFTKAIKPILIKKYGRDSHISMGYYYSDLKADIGYLNCYPSRKTLFYNLYLTEFIADFLFYLDHNDKLSFHYLYGKQMRHFEKQNGNEEAAQFYNRMYSIVERQMMAKPEYMVNAAWVSLNVILHELAHSEVGFIEILRTRLKDIENTFLSDKDIENTVLTEKEETEIACDCIAFLLMTSFDKEESCTLSNDEILGVSTSVILLLDLYRSFSEFTINNINDRSFARKKIDEVVNTLKKRTTGLIALIAYLQKKEVLSPKSDWAIVRYYIEETGGLLGRIESFLTDELVREIEDFNALTEEEKDEYRMAQSTKTWFYYQ